MKRIGQLFDKVADRALARHGRQQAMLVAHWREIAGEMADFTRPLRLSGARGARGAGLTLRLQVMPGRALEVQHMAPQLMERVNGFFGHGLVTRIACVQAPLPRAAGSPRRAPPVVDPRRLERLRAKANQVPDAGLAAALRRLAEGVARGSPDAGGGAK